MGSWLTMVSNKKNISLCHNAEMKNAIIKLDATSYVNANYLKKIPLHFSSQINNNEDMTT